MRNIFKTLDFSLSEKYKKFLIDYRSECMFKKSIDEFMYYIPFLKEVIRKDFKKKLEELLRSL